MDTPFSQLGCLANDAKKPALMVGGMLASNEVSFDRIGSNSPRISGEAVFGSKPKTANWTTISDGDGGGLPLSLLRGSGAGELLVRLAHL